MPLPFHIIDGYNLLHAAGLARERYGPGDLERVRTALLIKISDGLPEAERRRSTAVFDAHDPPYDSRQEQKFRELGVMFAVGYPDADELIELLIRRHSSPGQLRVVSDDVRIKKAAKRRGAKAVSCDSFLKRLARKEVEPYLRPIEQPPAERTDDTQQWLDYFGGAENLQLDIPPDETSSAKPGRAAAPAGPAGTAPSSGTAPSTASQPQFPNASEKQAAPANQAAEGAKKRGTPAAERSSEQAESDIARWQAEIDAIVASEQRRNR